MIKFMHTIAPVNPIVNNAIQVYYNTGIKKSAVNEPFTYNVLTHLTALFDCLPDSHI